jgi:hypothetical protein
MSLGSRAPIMGLVVFCVGQLVVGCGQDTPDRLTFALPSPLVFRISSDDSAWRSGPAVAPNMVCAGPQAQATDCCSPPPPMGPVDCQQSPLACDPTSNFCALTFDIASAVRVDLLAQVPEVAAVDGWAWSRVVLRSLTTKPSPLGRLPIRSAHLYVGPVGANGVGESVRRLGPIALVEGTSPVPLDPLAEAAFASFARDYRMPFALWLSTHMVVANGTAPTGTVEFTLEGRVEAWY